MASITERKRAKGPSKWEAVIRVAGRTARAIFEDKKQAEQFALRVEPEMRKRHASEAVKLEKFRKRAPGAAEFYGRKLRDVIFEFGNGSSDAVRNDKSESKVEKLPLHLQKKRQPRSGGRAIGYHRGSFETVLKHVGNITVGEAKRSWVSDYIEKMRNTKSKRGSLYSYESISQHLALMKAACEHAARRADLEEVKLHFNRESFPKKWKGKRERRLESWEDEAILAVLKSDTTVRGQHWLLLYQLALETGARLQELVLAQWQEIKRGGSIWVLPAEHTKTRTSRIVSLTPMARSIIERLKSLAIPTSPLLFHSFGSVVSVSLGFAARVKKAGVVGLVFHNLRHEAISRLVVHPSKPPIDAIMKSVGHKTYEMLNHYTHLREEDFVGMFD